MSAALLSLALTALSPQAEVDRLRAHFTEVLAELESAEVSHLDERQQANRGAAIERLRAYRAAGVFPKNTQHAGERVPYFKDDFGTLCAVGMLMDAAGRADLVEKVAVTRNNALVHELADDTEIVAWLVEAGLSLEEAARIQPGYTAACFADCAFCDIAQVRVVYRATVIADATNDGPTPARVTAVYGDCAVAPAIGDERLIADRQGEGALFAGDELLVEIGDPAFGEVSARIDDEGNVQCSQCNGGISTCSDQAVEVDLAVRALLSGDCRSVLAGALQSVDDGCEDPVATPVAPEPVACGTSPRLPALRFTAEGVEELPSLPEPDEPELEAPADGSCACVTAAPRAPFAAALLVVLVAALRRRRRG